MYGEPHAADTPSGDSLSALPAVLLVGGLGSRLRPVAGDVPKPMAPVAGRPFLEYVLLYLHRAGVRRAVLCVGHRAESIRAHFGSGGAFGIDVEYSVERDLLGTGGALRLGARAAGAPAFLALNGDSFAEVDLPAMVAFHRERRARVTMAL